MYEIVYGNKYAATKGLSRVEVAKLVRADIKAAIKSGELPTAKYSVTCESYSGGGSLNVCVSDVVKPGFVLMNAGRIQWDHENPNGGHYNCPSEHLSLHSEEASKLLKCIESIVGAYNYDGSDIQTDYFNVRFYSSVKFAWKWEATVRDAERALVVAALEEKRIAALKAKGDAVALELFGTTESTDTIPAPSADMSMPANDVDTVLAVVLADDFASDQASWLESMGVQA